MSFLEEKDRRRAEFLRLRAVQLYEEGIAIKPIADQLGSSFGTVHRVLTAEGVKLRPRPGR